MELAGVKHSLVINLARTLLKKSRDTLFCILFGNIRTNCVD